MPEWQLLADTQLSLWTVAGRLIAACLLAGVIGFEREHRRHAAGFRTHMLVALAAAVYALLMLELIADASPNPERLRVDPTRVLEAVTAGVAFLAAGVIIQSRKGPHGLTTAATLWLAGAVGAAAGLGYFAIAGIACGVGVVIILLNKIDPVIREEDK